MGLRSVASSPLKSSIQSLIVITRPCVPIASLAHTRHVSSRTLQHQTRPRRRISTSSIRKAQAQALAVDQDASSLPHEPDAKHGPAYNDQELTLLVDRIIDILENNIGGSDIWSSRLRELRYQLVTNRKKRLGGVLQARCKRH
jgi:hypothetical protein